MKKRILLTLIAFVAVISVFTSCTKSKTQNSVYTCNLSITGNVSTGKDTPVNGVKIYAYRVKEGNSRVIIGSATTNADGYFAITKNGIETVIGTLAIVFEENDKYQKMEYTTELNSFVYSDGDGEYFTGSLALSVDLGLTEK